ncbi:LysM peptidoglycan-binding domain-containing protein [Myxococcota bacterium]|nr:LysM peptidoglycan-binding domain-containing protein [Myxococcota bacterium]MBU1899704.1 LysM peptidoglycan-binding domain-containing protein [Myxococcota bacterium]
MANAAHDQSTEREVTAPSTTDASVDGAQAGAAEAQASEIIHVVRRGQTLSEIAQRHLGSAGRWMAVYEANREVIGRNPNQLKPGMKLTIPSTSDKASAPEGGQTHRVQRGENLSDIAQRYFGTATRWREIYNANRQVIGRSPNQLKPGMRLTIPNEAKDEAPPAKDEATPAKDEATPAKDEATPAKDEATPAKDEAPPAKDENAVGLGGGQPTRHTVGPGETLSSIAKRYYHASANWRGLFEANRGVIGHDPNMLTEGMVLTIPEPDKLPAGKDVGGVAPPMPVISRSDARYKRDFERGWASYTRVQGDAATDQAITAASKKTGVSERELTVMAAIESAGDRHAKRGSYRGLMQMGPGATADTGMDWDKVSTDVTANAEAGAKYWQINERQLKKAGYESNVLHQYLTHQQGFTGFKRMMQAIAKDPKSPATSNQLNNMEESVIRDLRRKNGAVTQKDFYDYWAQRIKAHEDAYDAFQKATAGGAPAPDKAPDVTPDKDEATPKPDGDGATSEPDKGASKEALPEGSVTANFTWREFACKDGTAVPEALRANVTALAEELEKLRAALGGRGITVNSGYRTSAYNKRVGGKSGSYHLTAKAADIVVSGMTASQVRKELEALIKAGKIRDGGIGAYATFTHYDIGPVRRW